MSSVREYATPELELAVIGCVLLDHWKPTGCIGMALSRLVPGDFLDPVRSFIWQTIGSLSAEHLAVDIVTIMTRARLAGRADWNLVGCACIDASNSVATSANWETYVTMLVDAVRLRKLKQSAKRLGVQQYEHAEEAIADAESMLRTLEVDDVARPVSIEKALMERFTDFEQIADGKSPKVISTGISALDYVITGMGPNQLWIVGGRPSSGKTALGITMLINMVRSTANKERGLFFSLEMSRKQLADRIISMETGIPTAALRKAIFDHETGWIKIGNAIRRYEGVPCDIVDKPHLRIGEICSAAERFAHGHQLSVVVVDYLQLVYSEGAKSNNYSREREVAHISRSLKLLSKKIDAPVIALAQVNRQADSRPDHRPRMSDLRESGSLEQDADGIIFVHRDYLYDKEVNPSQAELIVAKQRDGDTGRVDVYFDPTTTTFRDLEAP